HTRWPRDWSSDVCSSDLARPWRPDRARLRRTRRDSPWPASLLLQGAELGHDLARGRIGLQVVLPGALGDPEDLADGFDRLAGLRRLAMPLRVVLHERHALALDRVRHDEGRPHGGGLRLIQRLGDLRDVVAVDLDHRPAE